ncbi:MAG TPA: MmcQ/YjbR family DNA-binding protein [Bacteroidota bacterium]|nr:MmcQ/YjbR family DNA-binding protein [Bacteroidota bacterium]
MTLTLDEIRQHCLKLQGPITEEFPFGEDVLAFKIHGKIFLLTRIEQFPLSINLKCDPEHAIELREQYDAVQPGYHMHKKHWITVTIDGSIRPNEILAMINHSYAQVVNGLPKSVRSRMQHS